MKTVITYGTFDLFHIGHVRLLERARELGDRLIVGVSSDEFNKIKGKSSAFPYAHRSDIVRALRCVDEVFPENDWGQKADDIRKYGADILVMGHDWTGKFDDLQDLCEVVYLPRTEGISSTEVKQALRAFKPEKLDELLEGIEAIRLLANQLAS